jgi:hypothetical protein
MRWLASQEGILSVVSLWKTQLPMSESNLWPCMVVASNEMSKHIQVQNRRPSSCIWTCFFIPGAFITLGRLFGAKLILIPVYLYVVSAWYRFHTERRKIKKGQQTCRLSLEKVAWQFVRTIGCKWYSSNVSYQWMIKHSHGGVVLSSVSHHNEYQSLAWVVYRKSL